MNRPAFGHFIRLLSTTAAPVFLPVILSARLSIKLDEGFGTGTMQKYQPLQKENGIKVNHLHCHVFPRIENEGLFSTPIPNSFEGFVTPSEAEVTALAQNLR